MRYGVGPRNCKFVASIVGWLLLVSSLLIPHRDALAADPVQIMAFGDSLTAGYGLAAEDSFPAQLQRALIDAGVQARVANAGVSGDTTAGGLARLDWALTANPDLVIVALGANDSLRAIDPGITRNNLAAILDRLRAGDLRVLLAGMLAPPNLGKPYQDSFNRIYPDLAAEYDVLLYPFFLDGVAAKPPFNQADGIHPNARGVAVMVRRILPYVQQLLRQQPDA